MPAYKVLGYPVVSGVLAWVSTLVGNRKTACLFVSKDEAEQFK